MSNENKIRNFLRSKRIIKKDEQDACFELIRGYLYENDTPNPEPQKEEPNEFYPGNQCQRLFNWLRDKNFIALNSEMKEVIKIVHEDFPNKEGQYWTDELVLQFIKQFRSWANEHDLKRFKEQLKITHP